MKDDGNGTLTVEVANVGKRRGAEVVQLYIRNLQDVEGPLKSLRAFQYTGEIEPGKQSVVTLQLTPNSFEFWDPETNTMRVKPGQYEILVGNSSNNKDLKKVTAINL